MTNTDRTHKMIFLVGAVVLCIIMGLAIYVWTQSGDNTGFRDSAAMYMTNR